MLVIRAGTHKMLVRIAGSALFVQAFRQTNHLLYVYSSETAITGFLEYGHIFQTLFFPICEFKSVCVCCKINVDKNHTEQSIL